MPSQTSGAISVTRVINVLLTLHTHQTQEANSSEKCIQGYELDQSGWESRSWIGDPSGVKKSHAGGTSLMKHNPLCLLLE